MPATGWCGEEHRPPRRAAREVVPAVAVRLGRRVVLRRRLLGARRRRVPEARRDLAAPLDTLWHTLPRVKDLRAGDLVAFGTGDYAGHIGIYAGHDRFVNAVGVGRGVRIGRLHGPDAHANYLAPCRPQVSKRVRVHERPAPQAAPLVPYTA